MNRPAAVVVSSLVPVGALTGPHSPGDGGAAELGSQLEARGRSAIADLDGRVVGFIGPAALLASFASANQALEYATRFRGSADEPRTEVADASAAARSGI